VVEVNPGDAVTDAYAALTERAWVSNRSRADELSSLVGQWRATGAIPADGRQHARDIAHSLRGSAGTFGHHRAAEAAESLEQLLVDGHPVHLDAVADLIATIGLGLSEPPEPQRFTGDANSAERAG